MILTRYIIARRDLTIGDLVAQVAHAVGESFYSLRPSTIRHSDAGQEAAGFDSSLGLRFDPG
jgi:hypothetical protein